MDERLCKRPNKGEACRESQMNDQTETLTKNTCLKKDNNLIPNGKKYAQSGTGKSVVIVGGKEKLAGNNANQLSVKRSKNRTQQPQQQQQQQQQQPKVSQKILKTNSVPQTRNEATDDRSQNNLLNTNNSSVRSSYYQLPTNDFNFYKDTQPLVVNSNTVNSSTLPSNFKHLSPYGMGYPCSMPGCLCGHSIAQAPCNTVPNSNQNCCQAVYKMQNNGAVGIPCSTCNLINNRKCCSYDNTLLLGHNVHLYHHNMPNNTSDPNNMINLQNMNMTTNMYQNENQQQNMHPNTDSTSFTNKANHCNIHESFQQEMFEIQSILKSFKSKVTEKEAANRIAKEWRCAAIVLDRIFLIMYFVIHLVAALGFLRPAQNLDVKDWLKEFEEHYYPSPKEMSKEPVAVIDNGNNQHIVKEKVGGVPNRGGDFSNIGMETFLDQQRTVKDRPFGNEPFPTYYSPNYGNGNSMSPFPSDKDSHNNMKSNDQPYQHRKTTAKYPQSYKPP